MKPVFQTRLGSPNGNCWEACIASILEVPLEEIPDGRPNGNRLNESEMNKWLREKYQIILMWTEYPEIVVEPYGFYIITGRSKGGVFHCVVAKDGEIVHNPIPGSELESITGFEFFLGLKPADFNLPVLVLEK